MLDSERRLLKDDIPNKQRFIEILLNFNETTFGAATAKTLCVDLFRKIQILAVTAQYMKRNISRELRAYPLLEMLQKKAKEKLRRKLSLLLAIP